jgi:hypothetical protein
LDWEDSEVEIGTHVTDSDRSSSSPYLSDDNLSDDDLSDDDSASESDDLQDTKEPAVSTSRRADKVKIESSVRMALGNKNAPLLAFFQPCSREEHNANMARDLERFREERESILVKEKSVTKQKLFRKREKATLRQRRLRDKKREKDIFAGIRSPGGTKRKTIPLELIDPGISKKQRMDLAEETRPARLLKKKINDKNRKPQGRKKKHEQRRAKYHNWFTPACWRMIEQAGKAAGWKMSATRIVKIAKTRNPEIFENLSRETVRDWIDKSGERPRWSDATLRRVEAGNAPGHANGGHRGVFVSSSYLVNGALTDPVPKG